MKVLVVLSHSGFYRHLDSAVRHLCEQGHEVKVITSKGNKVDADERYQRQMLSTVAAYPQGSYDFTLMRRRGWLARRARWLAGAMSFGIYFRRQHNSPQLAKRMRRLASPTARFLFPTRVGRRLMSSNSFLAAYRRLQARVPADKCLVRVVEAEAPDVVVACPFIYRTINDVEYVRAAQKLGIPTVAVVASWDNLSTKGTFHVLPDTVVVWNQALAKEAQLIHAIPRDRLAITGAAKFDPYFGLAPSLSREEFCHRIGLDPDRPYLLYIGSSEQVAGDETDFVSELSDALRDDPRTAELQIVVRPHPLNGKVWMEFEHPAITVFPRGGQRPDIEGPRDDYFHTLHHSAAVAGVNTSAFLEAAITDRPCLSIVSARHREGQVARGHFQHLLRGKFIETVPDFDGAVSALAAILGGQDRRRQQRRGFVRNFVRPGGVDRPAGEVLAEAIIHTAAGGPREPEPVRPSRVAEVGFRPPARRGKDRKPPTDEEERSALLRLHDEHPVAVRQPLVAVSQLGGQGAELLNRLLDGHPQCHVHPGRLEIGHPEPQDWPRLDLDAPPEAWFEALREPSATPSDGSNGGDGRGVPFLMLPALQRKIFLHCAQTWTPASQREVLGCYFTAYFNAWLDYQNLYGECQRWVTAAAPRLGSDAERHRRFFEDYPDGRALLVVDEPAGPDGEAMEDWTASAEAALEARAHHGQALLTIGLRELLADTEPTMRRVAEFMEIDFAPTLCHPSFNGLPAEALPGLDDTSEAQRAGRAGDLYQRLVSAAS